MPTAVTKSGGGGSNSRHPAWEASALPLSYRRIRSSVGHYKRRERERKQRRRALHLKYLFGNLSSAPLLNCSRGKCWGWVGASHFSPRQFNGPFGSCSFSDFAPAWHAFRAECAKWPFDPEFVPGIKPLPSDERLTVHMLHGQSRRKGD